MSTARVQSTSAVSGAAYATAVLFFANLVGYMDRSILTLVVEPVKADLRLSDGMIGLMQGAAFVLTFSIAGLFIGRLVDTVNRRNLLILCVAVWSISAAACGLVQTGAQLFIARMGVGVGEAALAPAAVSLIADYFSKEKRGRPYGLFTMGVYAGLGLSLTLVASLLPSMTALSADLATRGFVLAPWRMVMLSMLLPGVISCILLAKMREPLRMEMPTADRSKHSGFADWIAHKNVLLPHHLAIAFGTVGLYAISAWIPTTLIREYSLTAREAGLLFGSVIAVVGICSAYVGGYLADFGYRRFGAPGRMYVATGCMLAGLMGFVLLNLAETPILLVVASALVFSPLSMMVVAGITALSDLGSPRSRGLFISIYSFIAGAVGTAGGPAIVGFLNDELGSSGVRLSTIISYTGIGALLFAMLFAVVTISRIVLKMSARDDRDTFVI